MKIISLFDLFCSEFVANCRVIDLIARIRSGLAGLLGVARVTSVILRNLPPKVHSMMQVEHFPAAEKLYFATAF
jgi:hypothetical protein